MLSGSLAFKKWIVLVTCCDGMIPDQKKKKINVREEGPTLPYYWRGYSLLCQGGLRSDFMVVAGHLTLPHG